MIFQYVGDRKTLSLVSRRFFEVASHVPQLWSRVSNRVSMKEVRECLTKSGGTSLDVELELVNSPWLLDPLMVFDAALAHSTRWRSLTMSFGTLCIYAKDALKSIDHRWKDINFTRLRSFSLSADCLIDLIEDLEDDDDDDDFGFKTHLPFFETVKFPALNYLHIPTIIYNPIDLPSLRSTWIELRRCPVTFYRYSEIAWFLSEFPLLEELRLSLKGFLIEDSAPAVSLPNLKTFRFDLELDTENLENLMETLTMPDIRSMHINIDRCGCDNRSPGLAACIGRVFCHDEYPSVEELIMECNNVGGKRRGYRIPFQKFPNLRTLCLDTPGLNPTYRWDDCLPALRTIHAKGIDCALGHWLIETHKRLVKRGELEKFEKLFEGKRIVWETRDSDHSPPLFGRAALD